MVTVHINKEREEKFSVPSMIAGQSCGEQVLEQRGDFGGVGQEPETDDKDGFRQRAEAG